MEKNIARLIDWVGKHDAKASVLLGVLTAMVGVLGVYVGKAPGLSGIGVLMLVAAGLPLAAGLTCLYFGNFPKTGSHSRSLLFFADIARTDLKTYAESIRSLGAAGYEEDLISQCHVLAQIVDKKFFFLKWAYRSLFVSIPFWVLCVLLLSEA